MKILKLLLILTTFAIIAFAWCYSDPADCGQWIVEHSEIQEVDVYGAAVIEESMNRHLKDY